MSHPSADDQGKAEELPPHQRCFRRHSIGTDGGAPLNFGPASRMDDIVYTSERPGNPAKKTEPVEQDKMNEWIDFMKAKDIRHVLCLLEDNELDIYPEPGLVDLYNEAGFVPHHEPMGVEGASDRIFAIIEQCEKDGEKIVVHCTGGCGRSGRICAGWVMHRYGLSAEDATREAIHTAELFSVQRKGSLPRLEKWMKIDSGTTDEAA